MEDKVRLFTDCNCLLGKGVHCHNKDHILLKPEKDICFFLKKGVVWCNDVSKTKFFHLMYVY